MPNTIRSREPLDLLRRAMPSLPQRLREVGEFLSQNDFDATTRSMRELATAARINPAAFTRLAQALGYTGWDQLRDALIETRRPQPIAPFSSRVVYASGRPSVLDIAGAALRSDIPGLERIAPEPTANAAAAIHAAPRVWVAGFRSCRSVAVLLQYQLRLFRPDTVHLVGSSGPEDFDLAAFRPDHAVVVCGFTPYSRTSVTVTRGAVEAGCIVVALADSPEAPMAQGADHLLLFEPAGGPGLFPSLTGAHVQAQALAAATFALGGQQAIDALRQTEARLTAHSQYVFGPDGAMT